MDFSIVFNVSGDSIPFCTVNSKSADLLCFYVEELNSRNLNSFSSFDGVGVTVQQEIKKLHTCIEQCNTFVYELLDDYIHTYSEEQYLDQKILNKIHADWVYLQTKEYDIQLKRQKYKSEQSQQIHDMFSDDITVVPVGTLIDKLGFKSTYDNLNKNLHRLECCFNSFKFKVRDLDWFQINNPFDKSLTSNNISNFTLCFNHLGRTLYNKFVNHDIDLDADDENTYNELLGFVEIKLVPAQTIALSDEYVTWARNHNRTPTGDFLNIGNIPNLAERLTKCRQIIYQNTLQNQTFSIQLTKG